MSEQELVQKKKRARTVLEEIPNSDLFDKARAELDDLKKKSQWINVQKKKIILELADKLENERGIKKRTISALIAGELKGHVGAQWIRSCLGEESKRRPRGKLVRSHTPNEREDTDMIWQIRPENYKISDVDAYDVMLCRDIIKYQHDEIKRLNSELARMRK